MEPNDLAVTPQALARHATGMEAIASGVAQAKQAGDTVRVGGEAYGQLCTIVPLLINSLQDIIIDAISAASTSLHETAQLLLQVADGYVEADSASEEGLKQIGPGR